MSQHEAGPCMFPCRVLGCTNPCDESAGFRHYCAHHRAGPVADRPVAEQEREG